MYQTVYPLLLKKNSTKHQTLSETKLFLKLMFILTRKKQLFPKWFQQLTTNHIWHG
jgi:HSP90 family molecular chaperone